MACVRANYKTIDIVDYNGYMRSPLPTCVPGPPLLHNEELGAYSTIIDYPLCCSNHCQRIT